MRGTVISQILTSRTRMLLLAMGSSMEISLLLNVVFAMSKLKAFLGKVLTTHVIVQLTSNISRT